MLVVGLNGSPKKEGNTAYLLKKMLDDLEGKGAEVKLIYVQEVVDEQEVPYCTVCSNPCDGRCYKDTALEDCYELLQKADAVILGSPVYFGTVTAQLKCFWDKSRKLRGEKGLLNTVGAGVTSGGAVFGGQETTIRALHDMMIIQGMILVGDGFAADDAGHHGVCSQQPSSEDSFALKRADILCRRIQEVAGGTVALRNNR